MTQHRQLRPSHRVRTGYPDRRFSCAAPEHPTDTEHALHTQTISKTAHSRPQSRPQQRQMSELCPVQTKIMLHRLKYVYDI